LALILLIFQDVFENISTTSLELEFDEAYTELIEKEIEQL